MSMFNTGDILETIEMFTQDNLDVRTVTMGISLLDCIDPDPKKACENIYNKITTKAANLVSTVEHISAEYGIPIINKRISVTPIAMLLGACPEADPVDFAKTLDAAGKKVGVNFVGGYSALVHKGFSAGDRRLIESIPRALAETDIVCSSVNIGATKAGLNMDAIKLMGEAVKKASELTADRQCIGAAKLVVFCNAPEDNPFMAGAFHGPGEPAPGYDHITAAIGGAVAAMSGAAFLCYVTPAEHLALPNVDDVKQGIVASKIAAHAADIAKGIPHARDIDDKMGDARRVLDWDAQFACALDPETAKAIRDARLPEDDHSDTCSMCGKFCAVRSMNKALAGEYIDIL